MSRYRFPSAIALTLILLTSSLEAHFPWISVNEEGQAIYYFGETLADRAYKMPPTLEEARVVANRPDGTSEHVRLRQFETDDFVGLKSDAELSTDDVLTSKVTYGIYHGSRLEYYSQHLPSIDAATSAINEAVAKELDLHARFVHTSTGIDVLVFWQGEPLADTEVKLYCAEGHHEGTAQTDENGIASFTDKQIEDGLNGITVGFTATDESGTLDGQPYQSVARYLTATFTVPENSPNESSGSEISVTSDSLPSIPESVTSFGAAVCNHSLYLYGGHTGRAHQYYKEAQANTLWRLDLNNPKSWESLGNGPRLQGLAMVTHGGKLYRIGGFTAKNVDGEDKDLWSQANVACYDPKSDTWSDLPALPEPRSSFDAVVLDGKIFVVGGWSIMGEETKWLDTAYVLDLSEEQSQWQSLPQPPFKRRALSVAALNGKVYAIGGMQQRGGPTTRVDVYDTETKQWTRGPNIDGEGMDGFGSSAFSLGGSLYVSTYSGSLQRLAADSKSWQDLHQLERDRFFHRLLPWGDNRLLSVGGASMSSGKFEKLDVIEIR